MQEAEALAEAIKIIGGDIKVAALLEITPQAVGQWRRAPAQRVIWLEKATGRKVKRHQLRPDLYPQEDEDAPEVAAQ